MAHIKPHGKEEIIQAILAAAVPLIAERGIRDVSFRDIARAADVQHSLITRHFGNKDALLERIGGYVGDILFKSTDGNGESFVNIWDRILREYRTHLRAIVRILLDTDPGKVAPAAALNRMEQTVQWFRDKLQITDSNAFDASLAIYLTVSFLMGTEVFGLHIQRIMRLSDKEFDDLRPRAIKALLDSVTVHSALR